METLSSQQASLQVSSGREAAIIVNELLLQGTTQIEAGTAMCLQQVEDL